MIGPEHNFRILGNRSRSQQTHFTVAVALLIAFVIALLAPTLTFAKGENLRSLKRLRLLGDPNAARIIAQALKAGRANMPRRAAEASATTAPSLVGPDNGQWAPANNMNVERDGHTATRLPDGRILVTGGFDDGDNWLNSAELYNPATNTWTFTPLPMSVERAFHTATLLMDGRVLVVGGTDNNEVSHNSAEIFDPVTNTWAPAAPMVTPRDLHSATLLADGRVLVTGGETSTVGANVTLVSSEIYDPTGNSWSASGNLATSRYGHTATLLQNGQVLVAGGDTIVETPFSEDSLASAERFNPLAGVNGTWSSAFNMSSPRFAHTATLLHNGQVLVVAGLNFARTETTITFTPLASVDLYDPGTNSWTPASPLPVTREDHTATLLPDGRVLVAGGEYYNPTPNVVDLTLQTSITYTHQNNSWVNDNDLVTSRNEHSATLLGDNTRVIAAGGGSFDCSDPLPCAFSEVLSESELFNAPIQLIYNGRLRDRVRQSEQNQTPDGNLDHTFTVLFPAGGLTKTITNLRLDSGLGGVWNTLPDGLFWTLGAASGIDTSLLNNPGNDTVNFPITPGGSFALFASQWFLGGPLNNLFQPGQVFTLTITFSDSSTATASTIIPNTVPPTVTVTAPTPAASEVGPTNGIFRIARTGPITGPLKVNYTFTGTAQNGVDFVPLTGSVVIPAGFATADVILTPIIDGLVEGTENVVLTITTDANYNLGAPTSATVTIADAGPPPLPIVTVQSTAPNAAEGGPNGLYTVSRTGSTAAPLTVFFTLSGSAISPGNPNADYSLAPSATSVTIPSGFSTADITLTAVDDVLAEPTETATLTISPNAAYTIGSPSNASVNIADNEPTVTVTATAPNASETGPTTGTFRISRGALTTGNLTVNYTLSGAATAPGNPNNDYTLLPIGLSAIIPNGSSFVDVTLTPEDDALVEGTEGATLTLAADAAYTIGSPSNATVNIADNDAPAVITLTYLTPLQDRVRQANNSLVPDGNLDPTFMVNFPASFPNKTVTSLRLDNFGLGGAWDTNNGTGFWTLGAANNLGSPLLNSGTDSVSFPVGASSSFVIFASQWFLGGPLSNLFQPGQSFTLTIGFSDSTTATASTTITALPVVTVAAQTPNAAEGGANGVFRITRNPVAGTPLTVNFAMSGTATAPGNPNADYSLSSPTPISATIAGGAAFVDVTLTAVDDAFVEPTEGALLTLVSDPGYAIGTPSSATVNIADNEPTVTVVAQVASAAEAGASGIFRISRNGTTGNLIVNYTLSGSATAPGNPNADYGLTPIGLSTTIPNGSSFTDVTLNPVDDALREPTETAILTLSPDVSYSVGSPSAAQVNIAPDNDPITITYLGKIADRVRQANNSQIPDGNNDGTFTVNVTSTGTPVTITSMSLSSTLGGVWNTNGSDSFWTLGAANTIGGALLNAPNDSVSISVPATGGTSFVIFASDWFLGPPFPAGLFQSGQNFTLTLTFSDASIATATTVIP